MKIAFLTTGLLTGGAEEMLFKLLTQLDRAQFQPAVISLRGNGPVKARIEELGIPVYSIGMNPGLPGPLVALRLLKLLKSLRPEILQGWMYHGNLAASLGAILACRNVPVIWNIRHSLYNIRELRPLTARVITFCAKHSSRVARILYCAEVARIQHERWGYDPAKSVVIPNGFDISRYAPIIEAPFQLRSMLSIPKSALVVGAVGRFHPQKDHRGLLEAAHFVCSYMSRVPGEPQPVHFVLAGRGVDHKNEELRDAIARLGLAKQVHLLGERKDIPQIMAGLDLLVSASSFGEAFPNVVGEAMSCGIPCVVTDVGDSARIVGEHGLVVKPRNPRLLATAICQMLLRTPAERQEMGRQGRARIFNEYSLSAITKQYERVYAEVGGGGARQPAYSAAPSEELSRCAE